MREAELSVRADGLSWPWVEVPVDPDRPRRGTLGLKLPAEVERCAMRLAGVSSSLRSVNRSLTRREDPRD